jgi:hypothetical protein
MALGKKTGGGSRKGKPNRAKAAFRDELQRYCDDKGVNPFHALLELATDSSIDDPHLQFLALKELCQYLQPKLRAVTLSGDSAAPLVVQQAVTTLHGALDQAYGDRRNGHAALTPGGDKE